MTDRILWIATGVIFGIPAGWCLLSLALLFEPQPSDRIVQDVPLVTPDTPHRVATIRRADRVYAAARNGGATIVDRIRQGGGL